MIGKRAVCTALVFGFLIALPGIALATSLFDLVSTPGLTITAHDKLFSDWSVVGTATGGGNIDLTLIDVTTLVDDPLNPGLKFTAPVGALGTPFGHAGPATVDLELMFKVRTTSGLPMIKDNSLFISDYIFDASPDAYIKIGEVIIDTAGNPLGSKMATVFNGDLPSDPDHFDSADFAPQSLIQVRKQIHIEGPNSNDGAFLLMFEQRFSQVPEPSGLLLAGMGWMGWLWRRKRRWS
jgi:hypothetical protein